MERQLCSPAPSTTLSSGRGLVGSVFGVSANVVEDVAVGRGVGCVPEHFDFDLKSRMIGLNLRVEMSSSCLPSPVILHQDSISQSEILMAKCGREGKRPCCGQGEIKLTVPF